MKTSLLSVATVCLALTMSAPAEDGWRSLFDGTSLKGWHISAKTGHSGASGNKSGGRWVVQDGAIVGSQDVPGNGGLVITDEQFGDFEVSIEMKNDFGPDSGLFLRSTEDGKAWQAMIDYHAGGNLMGIYGEGLGGNPHVRNYNFTDKVTEIEARNTGEPPTPLPVLPDAWSRFWRADQWNELRARIVNNPPLITTWINGVKIMEWQEKAVRHPDKGGIALQVHGGGDFTKQFVRYKSIRVKELGKTGASRTPHRPTEDVFPEPVRNRIRIRVTPRLHERTDARGMFTWVDPEQGYAAKTATSDHDIASLPAKSMIDDFLDLDLHSLGFLRKTKD